MPPPIASISTDSGSARTGKDRGDSHRSIPVQADGFWLRRMVGFLGPGYLVAVGYMDPGNWATDLAGGARFGYSLLWVIMLSSLMAIFLQILSARLGIVTGMDLAQACRHHYSRRSSFAQWVLCEVAICATDLAEVIGTAIALKLLFNIPLAWGVTLTVLDVLLVLWLQQRGFRYLEALVIALLALIMLCFSINILLAQPQWAAVAAGFIPKSETVTNPAMLYIAIGIIGATVMPHNLYLHSSIVQTRRFQLTDHGRRDALRFATFDVVLALSMAFLINSAILITSAAVFHKHGYHEVAELQEAYRLLSPLTGAGIASLLFGMALLASGQSSTLTATLAGQIVMEGYVHIRLPLWARRLLTRSVAIVPALFITLHYGESGLAQLLILSQVILSLQLPFAVIPLIRFTSSPVTMGTFANSRRTALLAWAIACIIVGLNATLLFGAARAFLSE
jgi:manganese transport protein